MRKEQRREVVLRKVSVYALLFPLLKVLSEPSNPKKGLECCINQAWNKTDQLSSTRQNMHRELDSELEQRNIRTCNLYRLSVEQLEVKTC